LALYHSYSLSSLDLNYLVSQLCTKNKIQIKAQSSFK
jgi:hypothetical protein